MEVLLGLVFTAVALGCAVVLVRARRHPSLLRADAAELDVIAHALLREHHADTAPALTRTLEVLRARGVPVGQVRRWAGQAGHGSLEFADGTTVIARAARPSDVGRVALAAYRTRVLLRGVGDDGEGVHMHLGWPGGDVHLEAVSVTGPTWS